MSNIDYIPGWLAAGLLVTGHAPTSAQAVQLPSAFDSAATSCQIYEGTSWRRISTSMTLRECAFSLKPSNGVCMGPNQARYGRWGTYSIRFVRGGLFEISNDNRIFQILNGAHDSRCAQVEREAGALTEFFAALTQIGQAPPPSTTAPAEASPGTTRSDVSPAQRAFFDTLKCGAVISVANLRSPSARLQEASDNLTFLTLERGEALGLDVDDVIGMSGPLTDAQVNNPAGRAEVDRCVAMSLED